MGSEDKNREREFSEYLDRILAGEDVPLTGDMSEEMCSALEFAREMVALRGSPSPSFQAELKQRLLHRMVEQEIQAQVR